MASRPGARPVDRVHATPEDGREAPGTLLMIDDEPLLLRSIQRMLRDDHHRIETAESFAEAGSRLEDPDLDVVLLDLVMRGEDGLEVLAHLKRERPEVEVVMMTGHASVESAVGCMRRGAFDYLEKPFDDVRVRTTVRKAIERRRLLRRNRELEEQLAERGAEPTMIGRSRVMRALARKIEGLRHNESHVLIQGESGTGKELVARAIHAASPRAGGPFVPVDCGALPETIIESELFGNHPGAFTGARGAPGLFRIAHGGTLFLDEVGEIPLGVQAKLLRALQEKEIRPVGAAESIQVDIRVVSATHRPLGEMAGRGEFRSDLFYRLNVVRLEVPPLRERREDIPSLVHHFLRKHARPEAPLEGIEDDALELLTGQDWPGNVRELENAIESGLAMARGPRLGVADLPSTHAKPLPGRHLRSDELPLSLAAYERAALERALAESGGRVPDAARKLGIGRSTFYRKLAQHDLEPDPAGSG